MVEAYDHSDFTSDAEKQKQMRRARAKRNLSPDLEDADVNSGPSKSGKQKLSEKEPNLPPKPIWNKPKIAG